MNLAALLCLLLFAGSGGVAHAVRGVVAPLNSLGINPNEVRKVHRWVTAAFAGMPQHQWLSSSRLERLLKQPRYLDCGSRPRCIATLASKIGADFIVTGDVGSLGDSYILYLRRVEPDGTGGRAVNGVLTPGKPGLRAVLRELAFELLLPEKFVGSIAVKADVDNAWIYLDGQRVARTPSGVLTGISVGTHALRVTHEAYSDFVRFVDVSFEGVSKVQANLSAFPVRSGEMKLVERTGQRTMRDRELPWYRRWWALTTFGAVLLAGSATAVAILSYGTVRRDSEATVRP